MAAQKEVAAPSRKRTFGARIRGMILIIAAAAVLAGTLFMPVFRIYGNSMSPTLEKGEMVAALKGQDWRQGDIIAFWYHNKILVKRLIAEPGSQVDIAADGMVYVDGAPLFESYLTDRSAGTCSIELPCSVPEGEYFVLGDARDISADSRNAQIGCIAKEDVIGRIVLRLWGANGIGPVW
ncbi:MAG: signal peptidase I [Clostridium sp.]|nr:signal peptidase I [Lachnoclostridium sp.]MCM1252833.1 signal peptidase I [Clostridium sp.]